MFAFDTDITYSLCDCDGKLKIWNIANLFQDCTTKHSNSIGVGLENMLKGGKMWVLSRWQIVINDLPRIDQQVKVGTWPTDFNKCLGTRNFVIRDENGNNMVCADTTWAFVDINNMRPVKAEGPLVEAYTIEPPLDMPYDRDKISLEGLEQTYLGKFYAAKRYMDTNNHMNNAQYIYKAMEYIPEDMEIAQIKVEYKLSIQHNAEVEVKVYTDNHKKYVVAFNIENGRTYALMEFTARA